MLGFDLQIPSTCINCKLANYFLRSFCKKLLNGLESPNPIYKLYAVIGPQNKSFLLTILVSLIILTKKTFHTNILTTSVCTSGTNHNWYWYLTNALVIRPIQVFYAFPQSPLPTALAHHRRQCGVRGGGRLSPPSNCPPARLSRPGLYP